MKASEALMVSVPFLVSIATIIVFMILHGIDIRKSRANNE